ncbi:hypothetical protein G195_011741, partial [Phytophthora kernoviae 00238/432]
YECGKTLGGTHGWCMGKWGHWLAVISQMVSCLRVLCAFLVLGGTVLADIIGESVVMYRMRGHPSAPSPDLTFSQVAGVFDNLSLEYGVSIVTSALQRQHNDPKRMPRVVLFTVSLISCLFLILASTAYSTVSCQITGNLLFSIYPNANTGLTTLDFKSSCGVGMLVYLFMQMHVAVAFSILLNPPFYLVECVLLGMHKKSEGDIENAISYADASTLAKVSVVMESFNPGTPLQDVVHVGS